MSLEADISYVYEKVYSKAHYDETIKGYIIKKENYLPLNLTKKQLNILKKMCRNSNIKLEYEEYRVPSVEDERLFKEYQELKSQIDANPKSSDLNTLEQRRIEIRNKIVSDNLLLVRAIIDRNFDDVSEKYDIEEIYQIGYDILFTLVDNHTIVVPRQFTLYLSAHLITDIMLKIYKLENQLHLKRKTLEKLKKLHEIISSSGNIKTIEDLMQQLGITKKQADELLNIQDTLNFISIDAEVERLENGSEHQDSPLYSDNFEREIFQSSTREYAKKILNTLPGQQKEVIMLAFGFKDGICYNDTEIANIMGFTNARISIVRQDALQNLKESIRLNYFKDIYETNNSHTPFTISHRGTKELEDILISQIPKDKLLHYMEGLPEKEQTVILLYYGFEDNIKHTLKDIGTILNVRKDWLSFVKTRACQHIRTKVVIEILNETNNIPTYEEYLNYLIKTYIINNKYQKQR